MTGTNASDQETRDLPEGYRLTELGPLPEEWRVVRLGEILEEIVERVNDSDHPYAADLPVLSLTKNEGLILQSDRFGKRIATEDVSEYKVIRKGQIAYNPYVIWEGAIHILTKYDAGIISPVYPVFQAKLHEADPCFLDAWLRTPPAIAAYNRFAAGAVNRRRAIRKSDFLQISTPLPPLPEQRAIARVLRAVQRAREATERVIAALRELKKSLMRHLFTYGPVPVDAADQVPMQETDIGPIPAHWRVVRLGEVASLNLGRTPARDKAQYWQPGRIPWVSISDLNNGAVVSTKERISEEAFQEIFRGIAVPKGTLLLSFKLTIGKVGILEIPAVHNEAIASIFPDEQKASRDFLFFLFQNLNYDALLDAYVKGKTLNKQKLSTLPIPLPPLPEQQKIAHILQTVDRKLEAEEARKQALEGLFKTLLHNLMTARRRLPREFVARFEGDSLASQREHQEGTP